MPEIIDSNNRIFVDPNGFAEKDLPVIVLCDDLRSFIGWAIKSHTQGSYNHAFIMHKPGKMVSQDFTGFNEKNIGVYLVPGQMLKFWRVKNMDDMDRILILAAINRRLGLPWWKRTYDFLGTFIGQFFHIKWLQNPFAEFCSEQVNDDYIQQVAKARVMGIKEPSPSELDAIFKKNPEIMEVLGYWWES